MSAFVVHAGRPDPARVERLTLGMKRRAPGPARFLHLPNISMGFIELPNLPERIDQPIHRDGAALVFAGRLDGRRTPLADAEDFFQAWRDGSWRALHGDWSWCAWDAGRQRLEAGRDAFGVKPLFYVQEDDSILLSNSLGALAGDPLVSPDLDQESIGDFLLFNMVTRLRPDQTPFRAIRALPGGHVLRWSQDGIETQEWWSLPTTFSNHCPKDVREVDEEYLRLLRQAVQDRMRAPKVGIAMSGGVDSPTVAAIAKEASPETDLQAWTLAYDRIHPDVEWEWAEKAARRLQLPHHKTLGDDLEFPSFADWDLNLMRGSLVPASCQMNRELAVFSPVTLNAYSADNIIRFEAERVHQSHRSLLSLVGPSIQAVRHGWKPGLLSSWWREQPAPSAPPFPAGFRKDFVDLAGLEDRWRELWLRTSPPEMERPGLWRGLHGRDWTERFSDWLPYESRDPYMDRRLLAFLAGLDPARDLWQKMITRRSMKGRLPKDLLWRRKRPLGSILDSQILASEQAAWNSIELEAVSEWVDPGAWPAPHAAGLSPVDRFHAAKPRLLALWLTGWSEFRRTAGQFEAVWSIQRANRLRK